MRLLLKLCYLICRDSHLLDQSLAENEIRNHKNESRGNQTCHSSSLRQTGSSTTDCLTVKVTVCMEGAPYYSLGNRF